MISPLQQITSMVQNKPDTHTQQIKHCPVEINKILQVNIQQLNFGQCLSGSIHQNKLLIILKENLTEPKVIKLKIICQDEQLNDLPQYIFGVRFPNQYQYVDQLRFKAIKKGSYQFQVGVKTPLYQIYAVKSKLIIDMQGSIGTPFQIKLSQTAIIPKIICPKQLNCNGMRIIKFSQIKGKNKKQIKILFRLQNNLSINITNQVIGLQKQICPLIDVKPKQLSLAPKSQFILTFKFNYPLQLTKNIKQNKETNSYVVRRLLVIKIHDTKFHYHFPIETTYYPESNSKSQTNLE